MYSFLIVSCYRRVKPAPIPEAEPSKSDPASLEEEEADVYLMAKSYFDLKEYDRCAFFTEECKSMKVNFLHFYARCPSSLR